MAVNIKIAFGENQVVLYILNMEIVLKFATKISTYRRVFS